MEREHFKLYVIAEMNYIEKNKSVSREDLFPFGWYNIPDYKFKTKVIAEALKNEMLIKDTNLYNERIVQTRSR